MTAIHIPRRRWAQPPGRVSVRNDWLDTGLGVCINHAGGPQNIVTGVMGVGGRSQRPGQYGIASRCTVAADAADVPFQAGGSRAFTWLAISRFDAPSTSWMGLAAAKRGSEYLWAVMRDANQTPTLFYRLWTGSAHGAQTALLLSAFGSGGVESISAARAGVIGFSIDANAGTGASQAVLRQYRDASEIVGNTTVSQAGTFDMSAAGSFFRAGGNHDGAYGAAQYAPWPHDLWVSLYWPSVALESERALALSEDFSQLFVADPIRIISLPSGGTTQDLAAAGSATATGAATPAAQVALAGVGVSLATGTASATGSAPLTATGAATASGSAAPSVQIALSALGLAVASGTAALSGAASGELAAGGQASAQGAAALVANVTVAASGLAQAAASAGLSAAVLLAGAGAAAAGGNAALAAELHLLAAGAAQASGSATVTGYTGGQLAAGGQAQALGSAALVLDVRLAAAGAATATGSATLDSGSTQAIAASGGAQAVGTGQISAQVVLTGAGFVQAMGAGQLAIQVPLQAAGSATATGSATAIDGEALVLIYNPAFEVFTPGRRYEVSRR